MVCELVSTVNFDGLWTIMDLKNMSELDQNDMIVCNRLLYMFM